MPPAPKADRVLVVSNAYPSDEHLYRNAFIHSRVRAYQAAGMDVDVFCVGTAANSQHYEFDGVGVQIGNVADYKTALRRGAYHKILIHFAHDYMVRPLLEVAPTTPVIVWVHGFETEKWYRRWFNLLDDHKAIRAALSKRETTSAAQLKFMKWLFTTTELDVTIVQVSEWFRDHVSEPDVGARARRGVVIPNFIDADHFAYRKKDPEMRLKLLSIRPYASRKYANDLTVSSILELARRPFFNELEFGLYGTGPLHARTVAPVTGMPNVHIHDQFVRHRDIPALHEEHGVFLVPTRFDSQGVSMCEAMASGLVPIATRISAIPEYVEHDRTGLLTAPESAADIADAVERLYHEPALFGALSRQASTATQSRCGRTATLNREVELIRA